MLGAHPTLNSTPASYRVTEDVPGADRRGLRDPVRYASEFIASAVRWLASKTVRQDVNPRPITPVNAPEWISDPDLMPAETRCRSISAVNLVQANLPDDLARDVNHFIFALNHTASKDVRDPEAKVATEGAGFSAAKLQDAYAWHKALNPGDRPGAKTLGDTVGPYQILPPEIVESSEHIEAQKDAFINKSPDKLPKNMREVKNFLQDSRTGFIAGIAVKFIPPPESVEQSDRRSEPTPEVIISFPRTNKLATDSFAPAPTSKGVRSFLAGLGILSAPKNSVPNSFRQAADLVGRMERHFQKLNKAREARGLPPCKLTVVGLSEGGALATFAALSADKPSDIRTVVINPSPLDVRVLEKIDDAKILEAAASLITITTVKPSLSPNAAQRIMPPSMEYQIADLIGVLRRAENQYTTK